MSVPGHLKNGNTLANKFPQFLHLWHPTKNGNTTPHTVTPYSAQKVWLLFKCGHETRRHVFNMVKGYGCPFCTKNPILLEGFNDLQTKNPKITLKWHPTLNENLTPSMVTEFSHKKVWWKCECGEAYRVRVAEVSAGNYKGCKKCNEKHRRETNILKYGTHTSMLVPKFKQKHAQTNITKYGTANPMSNTTISSKSMRAGKKITLLYHWKDNEELVCNASYEPKVVNRWNQEQKNFKWQLPIRIPDEVPHIGGRLYWVDAYLPDENLYIEIKGMFKGQLINGIPLSKLKWDWFHATYPNSELWDKKKLRSLGFKIA